jgi:hypothetical protein
MINVDPREDPDSGLLKAFGHPPGTAEKIYCFKVLPALFHSHFIYKLYYIENIIHNHKVRLFAKDITFPADNNIPSLVFQPPDNQKIVFFGFFYRVV